VVMRMIGTWEIVSSADFDDEYLNEQGPPYVQLQKDGDRIVGEYHLGLQNGSVDGRPQPDDSILLSFEGMDEMTEVHGAGTARVEDDRLVFTLMYHKGDNYTYEGMRCNFHIYVS
jgi:hypothetical protein